MTAVTVSAKERDDDADFTLSVGSAVTAPGSTVSVPITLSNPDNAPLASFSITLNFDGAALTNPIATRGADLPDPSLWEFSVSVPNAGAQVVAGNEFVQPADPVISGFIAEDAFTVPQGTAEGVYPLTVVAASVNGNSSPVIEDGVITVTPGPVVPVVSAWGVVTIALLLLGSGAVALTRRPLTNALSKVHPFRVKWRSR
jgi:hypothetical protein